MKNNCGIIALETAVPSQSISTEEMLKVFNGRISESLASAVD